MRKKYLVLLIFILFGFTFSFGQYNDNPKVGPNKKEIPTPVNKLGACEKNPAINLNADIIVYVSNKDGKWKVYQSRLQENGAWSEPQSIESINKMADENTQFGSTCMSFDGNTLYFCANFKEGRGDMDIWFCERVGNDWGDPVNMGKNINSADYDETPSISSDELYFYFARNNAQAKNKNFACRKIMVSKKDINGEWGEPIELSKNINADCEQSPRILADNRTLYFSSVRAGGKGKADLYFTRITDGKWSDPKPMNFANTGFGDQYASVSIDGAKMIYSISDLKYGWGGIYIVEVPEEFRPLKIKVLSGTVKDALSSKPLEGKINVYNKKTGELLYSKKSNASDGNYMIVLSEGEQYNMEVSRDKYLPITKEYDLTNLNQTVKEKEDWLLQPIEKYIERSIKVLDGKTKVPLDATISGENVTANKKLESSEKAKGEYIIKARDDDKLNLKITCKGYRNLDTTIIFDNNKLELNASLQPFEVKKEIKVKNFTFETGSAVIKKESYEELDRLVALMNEYPTMRIQISAHTDNLGKPAANLSLSQKRAQSVVTYLTTKGIDATRLVAKGFGLTKPIVANNTPENRAKNRRVEIDILEF